MQQSRFLLLAIDSALPPIPRIVAIRLATLTNRHGETQAVTYRQLAVLCEISETTVCAAIHRLLDLRIIERIHGKPRTRYQFLIPEAASVSSPNNLEETDRDAA